MEGMKKLLAAMFVALLMVGCGGEVESMIKEAEEKDGIYLNLGGVQISDLSPLAGLTNLERLRLSRNRISDLSPLKGLPNLKQLFPVSYTHLTLPTKA